MSIEIWLQLLGWSTLVNWGILLVWFAFFALARDWMQRLHGRWFHLSAEQFKETLMNSSRLSGFCGVHMQGAVRS